MHVLIKELFFQLKSDSSFSVQAMYALLALILNDLITFINFRSYKCNCAFVVDGTVLCYTWFRGNKTRYSIFNDCNYLVKLLLIISVYYILLNHNITLH
jgi:hypothetical protein